MATTVIKNTRIMQTAPPFTVNEGVDIVIVDDLIKTIGKDAGARVTADKDLNVRGYGKAVSRFLAYGAKKAGEDR